MPSDRLGPASSIWALTLNVVALIAGAVQLPLLTGLIGVSVAGVGLPVSLRSPERGLLIASLSLAFPTLTSGSPAYGALLFLAVVSFLLSGATAVGWRPVARLMLLATLFWGYMMAFTFAASRGASHSSNPIVADLASIGGGAVLFVTATLSSTLTALWVLSPGRSHPPVKTVYSSLRKNAALPLEILAFILTAASVYKVHSTIFVVVPLAGAYVWLKNATKSRVLAITIYIIMLYIALHVLGAVGEVDSVLRR